MKKICIIKLKKASKHKLRNKVVQKRWVITIGKVWEKIEDRIVNEVVVTQYASIKTKQKVHNTIIRLLLSILKVENQVIKSFK